MFQWKWVPSYRTIADKALQGLSMEDPAWLAATGQQKDPVLPHEENQMSLQGIPITIIGGDLGCGKTTLLNELLRGKHGLRLAVLINDFGSINIDTQLVQSQNGEVITLANGCICRSIGEGFVQTLTELVGRSAPPEHIIVEASGVSDPCKIYQYAMSVPGLHSSGIIILVDATTVRKRSFDRFAGAAVTNQMKMADLVILNKIDLVKEDQRVDLRAWLQGKVPKARFIETSHSVVPVFIVLGLETAPGSKSVASELSEHDQLYHSDMYEAWSYTSEEPLDGNALRSLAGTLPPGILRAKGVLCLEEDPTHRTTFQLVGKRWSVEPDGAWGGGPHSSRLAMIGLRDKVANSQVKQMIKDNLHVSIVE
jgi:G3E family GTPase